LGDKRDLFDVPDDVAYFNCAFLSPQLRSVRKAGEDAVARKDRPWTIRPADLFEPAEAARGLFAEIIGANADGVAITPSVSYGAATAEKVLRPARGRRVLLLEDQFPSNVYSWRELAARTGAEVVTVPRPSDDDWTAAVLSHLDGRVGVIAVDSCNFVDGARVDLRRLGEAARSVGAALVVDAIQSVGAAPLDVAEADPDFVVVGAYKWLLGPASLGFCYVAPRHRDGVPLEHGWLSRAGSENLSGLTRYTEEFRPGARRYDMGGSSNLVLLPMAIAAMRQLLEWGVPSVQAALAALTDRVAREATGLGLQSVPSEHRFGHILGIRLPPGTAPAVADRLAAADVLAIARGRTLRVSPHLHNDERDVDRLLEALADALGPRRRHDGATTTNLARPDISGETPAEPA